MKRTYLKGLSMTILVFLIVSFISCGSDSKDEPNPAPNPTTGNQPKTEAQLKMDDIWNTAPSSDRSKVYNQIQSWADAFSSTSFKSTLSGNETLYRSMVKTSEIMDCYDYSFSHIMEELKNMKPSHGEVYIWLLYNMGYVVKSANGCYAIDIYHYRGAELAPYIDFYAITHVHNDHKQQSLIDAMLKAGKPVISNFISEAGNQYTSTEKSDYRIGEFDIHTFITNHNNGSTNVPVTVFQITNGDFTLMHAGDSNFIAEQFDVTAEDIDVYITRYAPNALTENNVIGKVFKPDYVLLSHILELSHADLASSRWPLDYGLKRASLLDCVNSWMPFWGDRMVWKNEILK